MSLGSDMYVCAELRPLEPAEVCLRKRALRDAAICIGWLKFASGESIAVLKWTGADRGDLLLKFFKPPIILQPGLTTTILLTTGTNGLTCLPKHGNARKCKFHKVVTSERSDRLQNTGPRALLLSVFCYAVLFFLTYGYSEGFFSTIMKIMIVAIIPLQIFNGILLFLGALEAKPIALQIALWITLFLAAINTTLGFIGAVYFIRMGFLPMHFFLSLVYALLAFSIFTVMCHDVIVIYTLKTMLGPLPPELVCPSEASSYGEASSRSCCR